MLIPCEVAISIRSLRGGAMLNGGSTAAEPGAFVSSRTLARRLVATFLPAMLLDPLIRIRLVRFVLSTVLIPFARVSVALIHGVPRPGS